MKLSDVLAVFQNSRADKNNNNKNKNEQTKQANKQNWRFKCSVTICLAHFVQKEAERMPSTPQNQRFEAVAML